MKSILITFAFLFSQITFAAPATTEAKKIALDIQLSINGKLVGTPKMEITEGDPSTITQKTEEGQFFITVATMKTPTPKEMKNPENKNILKFQFAIGKIEKDGKETVLNRPSIITREGETATIKTTTEKNSMSLAVTAKYL